MTQAEAALIDLVRLVVRGDHDSIPRRVRKLLGAAAVRRPAALSADCRRALADVLDEEPTEPRGLALRRSSVPEVDGRALVDARAPDGTPAPVLPASARDVLDSVVGEHRSRKDLSAAGLSPTRSMLLAGPPGVGKTMTATWVAEQLHLPLVRAEPSTIITSLLGESARNLTTAFEHARSQPCVFLLDEVDAFAKRRDDLHDVGELKRFVTTLLVELERWPSSSLLIAATNHPQLLDPALHRRFEVHLEIPLPDADGRRMIIERELGRLNAPVPERLLASLVDLTDGRSGSDLDTLVRRAVRDHVLRQNPLEMALLQSLLPSDPSAMPRAVKTAFAVRARNAGMTTRAIGTLLGTSHAAVSRMTRTVPAGA